MVTAFRALALKRAKCRGKPGTTTTKLRSVTTHMQAQSLQKPFLGLPLLSLILNSATQSVCFCMAQPPARKVRKHVAKWTKHKAISVGRPRT